MNTTTSISGSSVLVDLTDGSKVSLPPKSADLLNLKTQAQQLKIDENSALIEKRTQEITQLKHLQDKVDSIMTYGRALARDLNSYDTNDSIYTAKKTSISADLPDIAPASYMTVSYENSASRAPIDIQIERLASYARVSASQTFDDLTSTTLEAVGIGEGDILEIGSTQISLSSSDTLQNLILKINNQSTSSGVEASYIKEGEVYRLVLNTKNMGEEIIFGENTSADVLDKLGLQDSEGEHTGLVHINGNPVTFSKNTLDLGDGRTVTLLQAHEEATFSITVENDTEQIKENITMFVGSVNLLVQEILWQEGLIEDSNRTDLPALHSSKVLRETKAFIKNLIHTQVSHEGSSYQRLGDLGIKILEDRSHQSVDFLSLDVEVLESRLKSNFNGVKDLLTNKKEFVEGGDENHYTILSGPLKGLTSLDRKDISVVIRYDSEENKYYADFSAETGLTVTTSTVEFEGDKNYITADSNSIFSGIVIKNTFGTSLSRLNEGAPEKLTLNYKMGLAGKLYYDLIQLENQESSFFPKGSMVIERASKVDELAELNKKSDLLTDKKIQAENRYLKQLSRLIAAEKRLEQARQRHQAMLAMNRMH